MPFYDYKCNKCDHIWEVQHMMAEKPRLTCPECKSRGASKMMPRIVATYVKGDGFLDVKGRRRDMNLHKLMTDDPYDHIRPEGDKEVVAQKLRNSGKFGFDKHGNKIESKFYQNKNKKTKSKKKKTKGS